jgi:hypothetical protein
LNNLDVVLLLETRSDQPVSECVAAGPSYLPIFKLVLLELVLLNQIIQNLLQPLGVGSEGGDHLLDRPLYQDAVDHPEALAISGKRL